MRNRAYRRHQSNRHMSRRLKEDRNEHFSDLTCLCWTDPKTMARFKEQPKRCRCQGCINRRYAWGRYSPTMGERRFLLESDSEY